MLCFVCLLYGERLESGGTNENGERGWAIWRDVQAVETGDLKEMSGASPVLVSRLKSVAVPVISNVGIPYLEGLKGRIPQG